MNDFIVHTDDNAQWKIVVINDFINSILHVVDYSIRYDQQDEVLLVLLGNTGGGYLRCCMEDLLLLIRVEVSMHRYMNRVGKRTGGRKADR